MKKSLFAILTASLMTALSASAAPSILDIKHSITDDNIIAPESFETKTRELAENFYLKNYVVVDDDSRVTDTGNPEVYEKRLTRLPTEIEMPYNSIVGKFIDMYLTKRRTLVADMLALHNYYGRIFLEELERQGMPTELQYLPVIESALNPNAVSKAGAAGLWQFMPTTAMGLGMEVNSLIDERRDPRLSSRNAVLYLKQLHDIYQDWSLAIAAYNCGPGNVNKAIRRAGGEEGKTKMDFWQIYSFLPSETRGYVPAFIAANYVMNFYRQHGIRPTIVKRQLTTDTVVVNKYVHFNQIASVLNIPVEEIRMLNPQFRKDIVPGDFRPYTLTLPTQQCLSYVMSEGRILDYDADLYARRTAVEPSDPADLTAGTMAMSDNGRANLALAQKQSVNSDENVNVAFDPTETRSVTHTVGRGENIRDIASRYGVSATDIKRWNNLRHGKVSEGDVLKIEIAADKSLENLNLSRVDVPQVKVVDPEIKEPRVKEPVVKEPVVKEPKTKTETKTTTKVDRSKKKAVGASRSHKVQKGDNLGRIAEKYGTTVAEIQKINGMKKSTMIKVGETIKIPAKK